MSWHGRMRRLAKLSSLSQLKQAGVQVWTRHAKKNIGPSYDPRQFPVVLGKDLNINR